MSGITISASLRGAKRRSNPCFSKPHYGLLRFARNDDVEASRPPNRHARAEPFGASMMAMQTIPALVARRESMLIRK